MGLMRPGVKLRSSIVARSWTRSWPRRRRMSMAAFARCPMRTSMPGLMPTNSMPRLVPNSRWSHSRGGWKSPRWYGAPSGVKSVFPRERSPASWVNHSWWRGSMSYRRAIRSMVRQVGDFFTQLPDSLSMSGRIASDGFAPGVTASRSSSTVCWASNQVRGMTSTSSKPKATGVCERGASSARGARASRQSAGMAARVSDTLPSSHLPVTRLPMIRSPASCGCGVRTGIPDGSHAARVAVSVPRAILKRMNENNDVHTEFFDTYTRALIDRDAAAIADHYAVPALIEFPGQRISVTDASQTESFFAGAFGQYEAVTEVDAAVSAIASTGHSIWADVTWRYRGRAPDERNMYQLVQTDDGWKIAVLTPLTLAESTPEYPRLLHTVIDATAPRRSAEFYRQLLG